jgi:hypothetical protein
MKKLLEHPRPATPKHLQKQALVFYIALFVFSAAVLWLSRALALVLLGSGFILLAPFIITERAGILKNIFLSVGVALACVFVGGVLWLVAAAIQ